MTPMTKVRAAAALAGCALTLVVAGCGQTVDGTALPVGGSASDGGELNADFDKLMRECEVVPAATIGEVVADNAMGASGSFNGAVCMWDVTGSGSALVSLNWYENGTLSNEKITFGKLGYSTESVEIQGSRGLAVRRPDDPDSCGVTASAPDSGVVGWWVNYTPGTGHGDPCEPAKELVALTLNRAR